MNMHSSTAFCLANIDRQLENRDRHLAASEYEITRQVIYHTADFDYYTQLQFFQDPLNKGYQALKSGLPIVVDVPEIQVSIVPQLRQTFNNPVFCCATSTQETDSAKTRAALGLMKIAGDRPNGIFIIGQDAVALDTLIELIKSKVINPSLAIAVAPSVVDDKARKYLKSAAIPSIYVDSSKGCASVASAIMNSLVALSWKASNSI